MACKEVFRGAKPRGQVPALMRLSTDAAIRLATFDWLFQKISEQGDVLPRQVLVQGFSFKGQRVPLMGPQGIFKTRCFTRSHLALLPRPTAPTMTALAKMVS